MSQAALFDLPASAPPPRSTRTRRPRGRIEQMRLVLPGEDAPPPRDEAGRDIERLVGLHQRALRRRIGVRESRRALMERISPLVVEATRRRHAATSGNSALSLEDAVQECMLWVLRHVDRYRGTEHTQGRSLIAAWIRMLVSQRLAVAGAAASSPVLVGRRDMDRLRAARALAESEGREPEPLPSAVALPDASGGAVDLATESTPESHALDAEEQREYESEAAGMWRMVARLPLEQRRLMRRIHRDGLELPEAAKREGITPHRAGRLYSRALAQLREWAAC